MIKVSNINDFKLLSLEDKIEYLSQGIENTISIFSDRKLYQFLKDIILNTSENLYVRKSALHSFINFILLGDLETRYGLNVLLDDWNSNDDLHLELERCKSLFLFYSEAPTEIEKDLKAYLDSDELELVAESLYNLGLIEFQKAFDSDTNKDFQRHINISNEYFKESNESIENRIDAKIFSRITSILNDLSRSKMGGLDFYFKSLAKLLFEKESYSFSQSQPLYIQLYRSLIELRDIITKDPSSWIEFKDDLDELYVSYCEIINSKLKDRLNESYLNSLFIAKLKSEFIQPYFRLNFSGEKKKIKRLLNREDLDTDKKHFLRDLIATIEKDTLKKKNNLHL